jgi:hypothetical protein
MVLRKKTRLMWRVVEKIQPPRRGVLRDCQADKNKRRFLNYEIFL